MSDWPALKKPVPPHLKEYLEATLQNLKPIPEGKLLPAWRTKQGWLCIQFPWLAVEGYNFEKACEGQGDQDIRRMYCLDWHASTGKRVLTEFSITTHVSREVLSFYPEEPLYLGWDMPGCPACVVTQLNPYGQWCILSSVSPKESESIGVYDFGKRVYEHLLRGYARPNDMEVADLRLIHYGDPAGFALPVRTGETSADKHEVRSCFDTIENGLEITLGYDDYDRPIVETLPGFGWRIQAGKKEITARLESLRARLRMMVGPGLPAFVICKSAHDATSAFAGYHYKERSDGTYELDPAKTWESHTVDAAGYIATREFEQPQKKTDRDKGSRREWTSGAKTKTRAR